MGYEQMTIFDIFAELDHHDHIPYEVGDEIVVRANLQTNDIESLYYLKPYFKKSGRVISVYLTPKIHYEVQIGEKNLMVYHEEVRGYVTL